MTALSTLVSLSISANTVTVSRQGFGTPLLMCYHTRFAETCRIYTSMAAVEADGFVPGTPPHKMALAELSQSPRPPSIVMGRLPAPPAPSKITITPTSAVQDLVIAFTVVDPVTGIKYPISYTIPSSATLQTVATALVALLDALPNSSAAVVATTTAVLTASTIGPRWYVDGTSGPVTVLDTTASAGGYDTALTALELLTKDFYAITIDSTLDLDIVAVGTWAEARKVIFFAQTMDTIQKSAGHVGATLKNASRRRTALTYRNNPSDHFPCGWTGRCLPLEPGTETWAYKTVVGSTRDVLTDTETTNLDTYNVNHYETVANVNVSLFGKVASGEFIDVIRFVDLLEARIKEAVFGALVSNDKIPFTDDGADLLANLVLGVLKSNESEPKVPRGLEQNSAVVTAAPVATESIANRTIRRYTKIDFSGRLSGAIHTAAISGNVTV